MQAMDLLEKIGSIRDKYVLSARETPEKKRHPLPCFLAATLALVLIGAALLQTPMGVAAVETVKTAVTQVIERLFPPRDIIVPLEGEPTAIPHEAQGQEPEADVPGFSIYVDTATYEMTESEGTTYIRPLVSGDALPQCEIEITHIPGETAEYYAARQYSDLASLWAYSQAPQWTDSPQGWCFSLGQDGGGDAPWENHYFVDDGQSGCFSIVSRYFLEAAEGHGARFAAMIQTFSVVAQDAAASGGNYEG